MSDIRLTPMKINEAQKYIDSDGPYKLRDLDTLPAGNSTLKEFLYNFIWKYERNHATVYAKTGALQTGTGRSRSMTDMARIAKYYFPNSNIVLVRNALLELVREEKMGIGMCYSINRRIFIQGKSKYNQDTRDEFGWKFNKPMNTEPNDERSKKSVPTKNVVPSTRKKKSTLPSAPAVPLPAFKKRASAALKKERNPELKHRKTLNT